MDILKKGFNGFQLKVLALIFMTFDHVAAFLWPALDLPRWFNWIGRLSAPLFIFLVAEGFYHTRNRKRYIGRLYICSILMGIGNNLVSTLLPHPEGAIIMNNIFATMFLITIYLTAIELFRNRKILLGLILMITPLVLSGMMFVLMNGGNLGLLRGFMTFVPTVVSVEGGPVWIILGIGCYLFRSSKKKLGIFYSLLSLLTLLMVVGAGFTYENLFLLNYQWLMVFALPFLMLYNGEKGKTHKYLFYVYYPVHCYVLYIIGILMIR